MAKEKIPKPEMPHPGHENHLCLLANLGYHLQYSKGYKGLVSEGKFVCNGCGRVAAEKESLCKPAKL
ncbi:MAG: hypothetical protein ACYS1A_04360 [Planctomycetota bacterium]|jgi:hypothetical protein